MISIFDLVYTVTYGFTMVLLLLCCCYFLGRGLQGSEMETEPTIEDIIRSQREAFFQTGQYRTYKYPVIERQKPIPGVAKALSAVDPKEIQELKDVKALRGGEFIGNRMRFKVKVKNDSEFMITDVTVYLLSFPNESLKLVDDDSCRYSKIEPGGFRSPTFDFLPTQDCVRGEIVAGVSFVDMKGKARTLSTKPFVIRSVCDLLLPDQISPQEFELKLKEHEHGEMVVKVNEWTPEEMFEKALRLVSDSNFFEVSSNINLVDGIVYAKISGSAKGKYTGKSIGVQISITGPTGKRGATCTVRVSGEDQAMILPAIDDLRERLSAWLCPMCGSTLTLQNVENLKEGKIISCPFCGISIGR